MGHPLALWSCEGATISHRFSTLDKLGKTAVLRLFFLFFAFFNIIHNCIGAGCSWENDIACDATTHHIMSSYYHILKPLLDFVCRSASLSFLFSLILCEHQRSAATRRSTLALGVAEPLQKACCGQTLNAQKSMWSTSMTMTKRHGMACTTIWKRPGTWDEASERHSTKLTFGTSLDKLSSCFWILRKGFWWPRSFSGTRAITTYLPICLVSRLWPTAWSLQLEVTWTAEVCSPANFRCGLWL